MQESSTKMLSQYAVGSLRETRLKQLSLRTFTVAATLLLAACAGTGLSGKTPEQIVEQRAQQRLDALMAWDLNKALEYTSPAYRSRVSKNQYGSRYLGVSNWTEAKVESVSCKEDRCDVKTMITYEMVRPKITNTRPRDEVWIKVDGQWYIYHK
ncbi:MAG: hypothetical protein M0P11_07530 [Anaerolineaceae bacterium]|nr:hypothetical protein [Anaerolineaceae bacterium]